MQITTELKLNISDLIEWVWNQNISNGKFYSQNGSYVIFENFDIIKTYKIDQKDLFPVTDVQDITLDTVIPTLLEKDVYYNYRQHYNASINDLHFLNTSAQFWIVNKDYTHTLIWLHGKLVN